MEVYHAQTPVRSMNQSVALFKSHQRAVYDELCKTKPKTFSTFGGSSPNEGTLSKAKLSQVRNNRNVFCTMTGLIDLWNYTVPQGRSKSTQEPKQGVPERVSTLLDEEAQGT